MTRKNSMVLGSVCLVAGAVFATATPTQANVFFFTSEGAFNAALEKKGKILKGIENYPWTAADGSVLGIDDPLDVNTAVGGWIKPGILLDNVTYQSNLDPQGLNGPNPRGAVGLALFTTGFLGATSNGLVANHFVDSFDILSGPPAGDNHTAMALRVVSFNNSPNGSAVVVTVFDKDDNLIGKTPPFVAPVNGGTFLGIITQGDKTIGRVNIYDTNPGFDAEGLYQLAVYVAGEPDDCPWDLDGNGNVGVGDLLILLANWNNPYGVPDLLRMLANWGPCPGDPPQFEGIECPFPPAADQDPLCENPELNCIYTIVATAGPCPPGCGVGAFLCVSPCPPPVQGACPAVATFLLPGGCSITAVSTGAQCQPCPQGACRILVIDPGW